MTDATQTARLGHIPFPFHFQFKKAERPNSDYGYAARKITAPALPARLD
jgi:hypothetical protein